MLGKIIRDKATACHDSEAILCTKIWEVKGHPDMIVSLSYYKGVGVNPMAMVSLVDNSDRAETPRSRSIWGELVAAHPLSQVPSEEEIDKALEQEIGAPHEE